MNRISKTILLAFLLGAGIGAYDVTVLMYFESGIRLLSPLMEVLQVLAIYGTMTAAMGLGINLVFRKWSPIGAASCAAALLVFADIYIWVHSRVLTNQSMFDLQSLLSTAGVVIACLVFAGAVRMIAKSKNAKLAMAIYLVLPCLMPLSRGVALDTELREIAKPDLPNVTILLLDTLRADRLSCYGYERADGKSTSPIIDNLATQGALFQWNYAAAPWTRPSIASMFSGLYPTSHGAFLPTRALPGWTANIAELFQKQGYRTAGFSANANISAVWGFAQGFEEFWCLDDKELIDMAAWGDAALKIRRMFKWFHDTPDNAQIINQQVYPWIERMKGSERPVFTYVQYLDPHFPYNPIEDLINDVKPDYDDLVSRVKSKTETLQPFPFGVRERPSAEILDGFAQLYDAEIAFLDRGIGEIVNKLRTNGLLGENDWLIITSDHGEEFFEHEQWGHGQNLYHEVIRVPLIVIGPGVPDGLLIDTPVSLVDLLPTLAEIVDDKPFLLEGAMQKTEDGLVQSSLPGISLQALWDGTGENDPRRVYAEKLRQPANLALRVGEHKLVEVDYKEDGKKYAGAKYDTLYDVGSDPFEESGFFGVDKEDFPIPSHLQNRIKPLPDGLGQALSELREVMSQINQQALRLQQSVESKSLSPSERLRLAELGYLALGDTLDAENNQEGAPTPEKSEDEKE